MKKGFSIELKIIMAVTVVMLAFLTVVVAAQIFRDSKNDVTFVYNSASVDFSSQVNTYDIFCKF